MNSMDKMDLEFEEIYGNILKYITNEDDLSLIRRAYKFAKKSFEGIFRKDGNPFVKHLLDTASIVVDLNAGPNTIIAALLHDCIEDIEEITYSVVEQEFSKDIADLVEAVTKVSSQEKDNKSKTVQKIFNLMRDDVRVIIVKLADRLNNMRTLAPIKEEKQRNISKQTLELYAPVARYLGLNEIARELEELCLFYLDRENYLNICNFVKNYNKVHKAGIDQIIENLFYSLNRVGIETKIYHSNKEIYKIYKYLNANGKMEELEDLDVVHVIVEDNLDCYLALGVVHSIYTPLIGKLKDYISSPKYNMYQALHTVVIGPTGSPVKIAIATKVMQQIFNEGIASKWKYNEELGYCKEKEQEDIRKHLNIIKELDRINMVGGVDSSTYVKILEEDVFNYSQYIYVYSTNGEVIVLPIGSTVLDFAFKIDPVKATKIKKLFINGLECEKATVLKNGCIVNIKYGSKSTVNKDWLACAKSNYTKVQIRINLMD